MMMGGPAGASETTSGIEWGDPEEADIRPGSRIGGGSCTANFIFSSTQGDDTIYIGTASHCVGNRIPGASITIAGIQNAGELAYCSWMHTGSVPRDRCPASTTLINPNDFALVKIRDAHRDNVHPAMRHWGGPTGIGEPVSLGDHVLTYGNTALNPLGALRPIEGIGFSSNDQRSSIYNVRPGIFGDSGSPVIYSDSGEALGLLVAIETATGRNIITNLANALDFMHARTDLQVQLETWDRLETSVLPEL
jgi:hypothetical protein